jgi:Bacterial-like globin
METAERRRGDEGRSVRDDGGGHASRSPWTERARTFSHDDPSLCQWLSRLAALDRRSTPRLILPCLGTVLTRNRRTVQLISALAGGPLKYEGRAMKSAHQGMAINDEQVDALAGDLIVVLKKYNVPKEETDELLSVIASTRKDIVGSP